MGEKLWLVMQGELSETGQLLARLDKRKVPYSIAELSDLDRKR
jgi:hypothetical protein